MTAEGAPKQQPHPSFLAEYKDARYGISSRLGLTYERDRSLVLYTLSNRLLANGLSRMRRVFHSAFFQHIRLLPFGQDYVDAAEDTINRTASSGTVFSLQVAEIIDSYPDDQKKRAYSIVGAVNELVTFGTQKKDGRGVRGFRPDRELLKQWQAQSLKALEPQEEE